MTEAISTHPPTATAPTSQERRITAILALVGVPYILLQALAPTAIPAISEHFDVSVSSATWLLTAYLLSASVMTPVAGRIGDMMGKRRVLLWVLWIMAAGTVVSAAAPNLPILILGRVLQGCGAASFPLAYGLIRDNLPAERVPGGIGVVAAAFGIGGFLGISLAGPIIELFTYHGLFLICGAIAVLTAIGVQRFIPGSEPTGAFHLHWTGALLMSGALTAVLLPLGHGNEWGWLSPTVIGLFAAGIAFAALWIRSELRSRTPLVDMRVLALESVWIANLCTILLGFGMFANFVLLPQLFTQEQGGFGFGLSLSESGLLFLPSSFGSILSARLAGRLYQRVGGRRLIAISMTSTAISLAMMGILNTAMDSAVWTILVFGFFSGLGTGTSLSCLTTYVIESVPPTHTAVVTGINSIARTVGGALGSQIAATVLALGAVSAVTVTPLGFRTGSLIAGGVVLVAAILMATIAPDPRRHIGEREAESAPEPIPTLTAVDHELAVPHGGGPIHD